MKLRFRRKGPVVDGQAFFCLVQADLPGAESLFEKVRRETEKLKLFSVQCDSFLHTGVVECGFATMKRSVGKCRLKHIAPNTPYYIAVAFNMDKLSLARVEAFIRREVSAEIRATMSGFGEMSIMSNSVLIRCAHDDVTVEQTSLSAIEDAARRKYRAGLDFPIVDKIQLRELKEQATKIRAIFRIHGRSPWNQFVLPSYECVQYIAYRFQSEVLHKQSRLQKKTLPMDHRFLIYGVSDPLTGFIVSLVQQLSAYTIAHGAKRLESTTGCILDGLSALGTRHPTPSLNGPWIIDWYDFLLLVACDDFALRRIYQCATQFNGYDVEGQALGPRISWMVKPENIATNRRGSLLGFFVDSCKLEAKDKFTADYIPAPVTAARAIWSLMPLRTQHRAAFYVPQGLHQLQHLQTAYLHAKRETLHISVIQSFLQRTRRAHARWRLRVFLAFVDRRYSQRECVERKRLMYATLLDRVVQQERITFLAMLRDRFHHWKRVSIYFIQGTVMELKNKNICRLNFMRKWRLFVQPQYRILPADRIAMPPMPAIHIRRFLQQDKIKIDGEVAARRKWVVLSQFGSHRFETVIDLPLGEPIVAMGVGSPLRPNAVVPVGRLGHVIPLRRKDKTALLSAHRRDHVQAVLTASPAAPNSSILQGPLQLRSTVQLGPKDYLMLEMQRLTSYRILFHRFSWWRVLVMAWSEKRQMQQRQATALRALLSASNMDRRQMVFSGWKQLAQHRLHRAQIMVDSAERMP